MLRLLGVLCAALCVAPAMAATIVVDTSSISGGGGDDAFAAALAKANPDGGDVIYMPAGTYSWNAAVELTTPVHVIGAGIDQTIIQVDAAINYAIRLNATLVEIGHMTLRWGTGTTDGIIVIGTGSAASFDHVYRLHHLRCTDWGGECLKPNAYALIDNLTANAEGNSGTSYILYMQHNFGTSVPGDLIWSRPAHEGTADALYAEDNTHTGDNSAGQVFSDGEALRAVYRYNTSEGRHASHEGAGQDRASRWQELYQNSYAGVSIAVGNWRGGSGIMTRNHIDGNGVAGGEPVTKTADLSSFRRVTARGSTWKNCNPSSGWDDVAGATLIYSGTADSGGTLTMTDGPGGPSNRPWNGVDLSGRLGGQPYMLVNTTTSSTMKASVPNNDTTSSNTITVSSKGAGDPELVFAAGDTYEIWLIPRCLDEPGLGQGDLINRASPAHPNQIIEGVWVWNNTCVDVGDSCAPAFTGADQPPTAHFHVGVTHPTWTPYIYRCPTGQLADATGCLGKGGTQFGRQPECTYRNGCGHPRRWHTSILNVRSRPAVAVPPAVVDRPAVTTRLNSE